VLTWSQRFRFSEWVRASTWLIPAACVAVAILLAQLLPELDKRIDADPAFVYGTDSAQELLSAIAAGMIAFTGFVFSMLILAVQFGSTAFTPRLLRSFDQGLTVKLALGAFVATFIYALLVLSEVSPADDKNFVPQYSVNAAVVLVGLSVLMFLLLIASVTGFLRASRVVADTGRTGRRAIDAAFPQPAETPEQSWTDHVAFGAAAYDLTNPGRAGVVQAFDPGGISTVAEASSLVVEMLPAVGEFVAHGAAMFRVSEEPDSGTQKRILDSIALGEERTSRQDPAYALRILVDIAIKALSPAINDPTTAVQALDQIEDTLLMLAGRRLPDGVYRDGGGEVRFLYRTPSWEEYLDLAFTEIRTYGADSPQVVRRLRDVLRSLRAAVPAWRMGAIDEQSQLLEEAVATANP
jgi:uncharacterized membrane protein